MSDEPYTPEEMETLKHIVAFNELIDKSIEEIGWDATGAALCIAFFEAIESDELELRL